MKKKSRIAKSDWRKLNFVMEIADGKICVEKIN
jgi:hypothetical protein